MIIEDDKNQTELLETLLGDMNYEVNSVYTGREGVEILTRWTPDIILLDLHLPDIDGIQVAQEISGHKHLEHVPIIMMSADYKEETVIGALANGIDEFISKPIRMAELTLRISTMIKLKYNEKQLNILNGELEGINEKLEKEKNILAHYFSYDFVEHVLNETISPNLGGNNVEASILFFDLRNSTHIAESMKPELFSVFLSNVLKDVMDIIFDHLGSVNKLLGDGILATFGCPEPSGDDAENCCRCALAIRKYLENFNEKKEYDELNHLRAGVGIATGNVFAGNIGSNRRMEYTVLGDPVNLASRLEDLSKLAGLSTVDILIDQATREKVTGKFHFKKVRTNKVRGRVAPVSIFYLDGLINENFSVGEANGSKYEDELPKALAEKTSLA